MTEIFLASYSIQGLTKNPILEVISLHGPTGPLSQNYTGMAKTFKLPVHFQSLSRHTKGIKLLNSIGILGVLAAKSSTGIAMRSASDENEGDSKIGFQTRRTPAKIRRLHLITEIRRMVGQGRSYREIMDTLVIPERSFYRYLSQAYEHDRQLLLAERDKDNLALELGILHDIG